MQLGIKCGSDTMYEDDDGNVPAKEGGCGADDWYPYQRAHWEVNKFTIRCMKCGLNYPVTGPPPPEGVLQPPPDKLGR